MTTKEKAIRLFEDIAYECDKLTSGNVAHLKAQIKGMAIRSAEYLKKHSQEPASEDLDTAIERYIEQHKSELTGYFDIRRIAKHFAQWQMEQFEKNRLAHCDAQTEEEAEVESDFVMGIIGNEHRQPTFDDAIKYGMRLQREQMMKNAIDTRIDKRLADMIGYTGSERVKVIIIKE